MAQDDQIPAEVVELWLVANKYRGRQMRLTMFLRADGGEAETAVAIKAYVRETGQAMLNLANSAQPAKNVKLEPCPTRFEPEGGAYFQREMSLSGESEGGREWVDHRKDGDQHGRIKAVND
jgi:hypothetical protein